LRSASVGIGDRIIFITIVSFQQHPIVGASTRSCIVAIEESMRARMAFSPLPHVGRSRRRVTCAS